MARWEPNAEGRLGEAAMALYVERGYEQTTVADIAERAGLTSRTFFRYFADKREVLFARSEELEQALVDALEAAPQDATPMEAVAAALDAAARLLGRHREHSRARQAVIDSSAEPGTWPHDQRQAFRTLRQRIHYQSVVEAYLRSYHVARYEPQVYAAMGDAAAASLQRYCSIDVVRPRLHRFIHDRLEASSSTEPTHAGPA